jgi:hypothetical protein
MNLLVIFVAILSAQVSAQCGAVDRNSPGAVTEEVRDIFNRALDRMEYTLPSGVRASTWSPPDSSVRAQLGCLGNAAVPATADLLRHTTRSFGHILAIQMLSWEGGPEIVQPLAEVLAKPEDPSRLDSVRLAAIEALGAAPPERALPVIEQAMHSERNPTLLRAAARVRAKLMGSGD